MSSTTGLDRIFDSATIDAVPATRSVPDLDGALALVRRLGGAIVSETRTAPGIGSWAFVADRDGAELVLWQDAAPIGA